MSAPFRARVIDRALAIFAIGFWCYSTWDIAQGKVALAFADLAISGTCLQIYKARQRKED